MRKYARGGYIKPATDRPEVASVILSEGCACITPTAARAFGADLLKALNRQSSEVDES